MRRNGWALLLVAALLSGGCSSSSEPAVRSAASSFEQALARRDGPTACGLLSSEARERLETATGRSCAEALPALALPSGQVDASEVWGDEAQVHLRPSSTVFLAEFRDGWRVTAAGCSPRPDQPYACIVRA